MKKVWIAMTHKDGKFFPPYFWVQIFLFLAVFQFIEKLTRQGDAIVSDQQFLGTLSFIVAWCGVFTAGDYFKKKLNGNGVKPEEKSKMEAQ